MPAFTTLHQLELIRTRVWRNFLEGAERRRTPGGAQLLTEVAVVEEIVDQLEVVRLA